MPLPRLKDGTKSQCVERVMRIQAGTPRRWGTMSPAQAMRHLNRSIEISLGEVPIEDKSNFLTRSVLRWLAFHVLPFPKGKIKAPEIFTPPPEHEFEEERRLLLEAIDRFCREREQNPQRRCPSPIFGQLTLDYWGHVHAKHFDHHLRQFGM